MNFLGEQTLAANLGERTILHRIAGGADVVFLEHVHPAQNRAEMPDHRHEVARLHQCERRGTRANAQRESGPMRMRAGLACVRGVGDLHASVVKPARDNEK